MSTTTLFRAISLVTLAVVSACAKDPVDPVNKANGIALKGYDPVAYFKVNKPVKGSAEISTEWNGAKWYFANAENRDLFKGSPEKYAPQFGGYCAWAVGHGYTAPADPEAWAVVEDKLYLNYNKDVQKKWKDDQRRWIGEGDKNWPSLHK